MSGHDDEWFLGVLNGVGMPDEYSVYLVLTAIHQQGWRIVKLEKWATDSYGDSVYAIEAEL